MTPLQGRIGRIDRTGVRGWATDPASPGNPVELEIVVDDQVVQRVHADRPRPGLHQLPPARRRCGFQLRFPRGLDALAQHTIRVRRASDGTEIEGSPAVLRPEPGAAALEETLDAAIGDVIHQAPDAAALDAPLRFVARQLDTLLGDGALPPQQARLRQRAQELLASGALPAPARDAPRALVITGDARRYDSAARFLLGCTGALVRAGLRVDCAATEADAGPVPFTEALEASGATLLHPPWYAGVEDALKRNRGQFRLIWCDGLDVFERYAALARYYCPNAKLIYAAGELQSVLLAQRGEMQRWPAATALSAKLRVREALAAMMADRVAATSPVTAERLHQAVQHTKVTVIPCMVEMCEPDLPFGERSGMAFLGDHARHADLDAARILIEHILPRMRTSLGPIACVLGWDRCPDQLRKMARDGISIVENADPAQVLRRARLAVAPLRYGAGPHPTLLASLGAGLPCIASPAAAEGMEMPDALQACIGRTVQDIAAIACAVYVDEAAHRACAQAGMQQAERFGTARVDALIRELAGVKQEASTQRAAE